MEEDMLNREGGVQFLFLKHRLNGRGTSGYIWPVRLQNGMLAGFLPEGSVCGTPASGVSRLFLKRPDSKYYRFVSIMVSLQLLSSVFLALKQP